MDRTIESKLTANPVIRSILPPSSALGVIGISPFSSRFTTENIKTVVEWGNSNYSSFKLFIPDKPTIFSLMSVGYNEAEAVKKMKKQCRYLRNKCLRAIEEVNRHRLNENPIIEYDILLKSIDFTESLDVILREYENSITLQAICHDFSTKFLLKNGVVPSKHSVKYSSQYILYELPVFLYASKIFNVSDAFFMYPELPSFLNEIIKKGAVSNLISNQEFIEYKIWR